MKISTPKCFISYSWDSLDHQEWVRKLASRLIENGVSTSLDQWDVKPGQDMTTFMEYSIRESDFVFLICTTEYAIKANDAKGGVGYEKNIITGETFSATVDATKFIPILRNGNVIEALPSFLKSKMYIDFRNDNEFDIQFENLLRNIYETPKFPKPELGNKPDFSKSINDKIPSIEKSVDFLTFKIGKAPYFLKLPLWWNDIEVDTKEILNKRDDEIPVYVAQKYGADVGTSKTWKKAYKTYVLYHHNKNGFPVYAAHCASEGKEFDLAARLYCDLYNLVDFLPKDKRGWYHTYLSYSAGKQYENLEQIGLAIKWYSYAIKYLPHKDKAISYYAELALERKLLLENTLQE